MNNGLSKLELKLLSELTKHDDLGFTELEINCGCLPKLVGGYVDPEFRYLQPAFDRLLGDKPLAVGVQGLAEKLIREVNGRYQITAEGREARLHQPGKLTFICTLPSSIKVPTPAALAWARRRKAEIEAKEAQHHAVPNQKS
jgi:hypothetical protein